ncbi:MAG: FkbM family methyltransferase [Bacteroidetes bacterium]|nr:FkbM family methyltransferase [Bacteroidota bacterium]
MSFYTTAIETILAHLPNDFSDNWDENRFGGKEPSQPLIKSWIKKQLSKWNYYNIFLIKGILVESQKILKFEYLYNSLETDDDRKLLLQVISFRFLGHRKVKLPLNTPDFWTQLKGIEKYVDTNDFIDPHFLNFKLYKMDINPLGFPIQMYFSPGGVLVDFIVKQYEYSKNGVVIKAEEGDVVIDGGACWGDTALYFANTVGEKGSVFSFEFIPNNIAIFNRNLSLNTGLMNRITLIPNPLWSNSTDKVFFKDFGPGSNVSLSPFSDASGECTVACLDDLISASKISRIDFLKFDIEGAELNALKGAAQAIKKFKPKLAIALYHSYSDFEDLPKFLKEIVPEYKFYFSHCSIHAEESMLFAKV